MPSLTGGFRSLRDAARQPGPTRPGSALEPRTDLPPGNDTGGSPPPTPPSRQPTGPRPGAASAGSIPLAGRSAAFFGGLDPFGATTEGTPREPEGGGGAFSASHAPEPEVSWLFENFCR
jgi:hypothetical protein